MFNRLVELIATFFYVGRAPFAPGSLASILGIFLYMILWGQWGWYVGVTGVITLLGFLTAGKMERLAKEKDPGCVVIDEVAGMLIAFWGLPMSWPVVWITFFLFRAFDMFKIFPCGKFEKLPGSLGIMTDDIIAGVYTNLIVQLALRMTSESL